MYKQSTNNPKLLELAQWRECSPAHIYTFFNDLHKHILPMSLVNQVICIYINSPTYNTICHGENNTRDQLKEQNVMHMSVLACIHSILAYI